MLQFIYIRMAHIKTFQRKLDMFWPQISAALTADVGYAWPREPMIKNKNNNWWKRNAVP